MAAFHNMSRTMRIDLIPDVPSRPIGDKRRVIVKTDRTVARTGCTQELTTTQELTPYQELLDSIYDAAVIADLKGTIKEVNARAVQFLQWSKAEIIGVSVSSIIYGADDDLIAGLVKNLEHQRFTLIQAHCVRKDGTVFPSEIAVNRLKSDNGRLCFFIRDITLRRQAEEMLRTEHCAIQNAANGIAIANLEGLIEYANPAFAAMIGIRDHEEFVGISIHAILEGTDMSDEMFKAVIDEDRTWRGEVSAELPSGQIVDLDIQATPNRNSDGEKVGVVFSFSDLSDRKRAEAALRETDRQRVMLETLGAACHHLGQPATVLMANLGLMRNKISNEDALLSELIDSSMVAIRRLGDTLHKLNCVNEYRTTSYMGEKEDTSSRSRILEI
jgi:PAS domain S-box-containing protein